jgi:hypothetical protein
MHLHSLEREEENPKENTLPLLSQGGTARQSCSCSFANTLQPLTCGELGESCVHISQLYNSNAPQMCVWRDVQGKAHPRRK